MQFMFKKFKKITMGQNESVLMLWIYNNVFIKENEVIDTTP